MTQEILPDVMTIEADGKPITCAAGSVLLNALLNAGVMVQTACGGKGTCYLCRVTVEAANEALPPATAAEKKGLGNVLLAQKMRLSCQITTSEGMRIRVPHYETPEERRERIRRARERR